MILISMIYIEISVYTMENALITIQSRKILQQILKISFLGWKNGGMVGRSFHYKFGVHFPGKMARCICVFTVIGALWEFSAGSSGSTESSGSSGRTGIEINPNKMDPWFPTPGNRMTVVFHKTPSTYITNNDDNDN